MLCKSSFISVIQLETNAHYMQSGAASALFRCW